MLREHPILARILYLSGIVILSALVPLAIGVWADRRLETAPWLTLASMLAGVTAATVGIWRIMQRTYGELERQHSRADDAKEAGA